MFQKAKNLDTAFRQVRTFCLCVVAACTLICGAVIYSNYKATIYRESRIYVLASGKAIEAFAGDRKENLPVEARDHVRTFHHYFFTLDPDDKVIQNNITKALYLADGSARSLYESLKENNYYTGLISGNISQEISVDSVAVDMDTYPHHFRCWATEHIIRPSSITQRTLVTEGWLRHVSRSDNNPHGFLIEKWNTLENRDIKTEPRP
ncbi:MAG: conjugative transposon protein TraK [Flaviaesturariibacter sp.]|nr:conjugative transposon protein TraK [Flaviaesturariibacter sp.]